MVCRQLGYSKGAIEATDNSLFGTVPNEFSYDLVSCRGDEAEIHLCTNYGIGQGCGVSNGAGVICDTGIPPAGKH